MKPAPESTPIDRAESIASALGGGAYVFDAARNRVSVNDRLHRATG